MADSAAIRAICDRNVKTLTLKPEKGRLTATSRARVGDGLSCVVLEGPWQVSVDLPAKVGGEDTGPSPGVLGRAALASCTAISIRIWAARLEIPIDAIEVEVQTDFDARGELGMGDVSAGYQEVRYVVSIESPAPEDSLIALLDKAARHTPFIDVFGRAQPLKRVLQLNGREV